ncbi:MAG: transcriptional repressor [Robiginitomaculum sp.]|nr:MAG: transcriptional repressor [Robiginitomaculum sp.]
MPDILEDADRHCAKTGARLTPLRRRVLELVARSGAPVKAYDLLSQIDRSSTSAKPPTVYRALDFLIEAGLVHRVEALNAFVACPQAGHGHAAVLYVCESCANVTEVQGARPGQENKPPGFTVKRSVIEHYGLCVDCPKP